MISLTCVRTGEFSRECSGEEKKAKEEESDSVYENFFRSILQKLLFFLYSPKYKFNLIFNRSSLALFVKSLKFPNSHPYKKQEGSYTARHKTR